MDRPQVNYNHLAPTYHSRYAGDNKLDGIAQALGGFKAHKVLEVGCGTGRFVESLRNATTVVIGVDASTGMLSQASARLGSDRLTAARANQLPFLPGVFDLVYCVNALHHFDDPRAFIGNAADLLQAGGSLALIGMDPRTIRHRYFYDYFEGALALDMRRYPSFGQIVDWTSDAGLERVELKIVEQPSALYVGANILNDPFLVKESNSLLALLSNEVYTEGLRRIQAAASQGAWFYSEIAFGMITGRRSATSSAKEIA